MKKHQLAWLKAHPERSREWLQKMMMDGFDVHHVDLDHSNNHPDNMVLIDGVDHMRLHGMFRLRRPEDRETVRKAATARWAKTPPEERSAHARMMGMARWKADRKRRKQRLALIPAEMAK